MHLILCKFMVENYWLIFSLDYRVPRKFKMFNLALCPTICGTETRLEDLFHFFRSCSTNCVTVPQKVELFHFVSVSLDTADDLRYLLHEEEIELMWYWSNRDLFSWASSTGPPWNRVNQQIISWAHYISILDQPLVVFWDLEMVKKTDEGNSFSSFFMGMHSHGSNWVSTSNWMSTMKEKIPSWSEWLLIHDSQDVVN